MNPRARLTRPTCEDGLRYVPAPTAVSSTYPFSQNSERLPFQHLLTVYRIATNTTSLQPVWSRPCQISDLSASCPLVGKAHLSTLERLELCTPWTMDDSHNTTSPHSRNMEDAWNFIIIVWANHKWYCQRTKPNAHSSTLPLAGRRWIQPEKTDAALKLRYEACGLMLGA